jgi:hypothetical protein
MSRVIKMSTPKRKPAGLPKTAALGKAQADHKKWLKTHGIKTTKNSRSATAFTQKARGLIHDPWVP